MSGKESFKGEVDEGKTNSYADMENDEDGFGTERIVKKEDKGATIDGKNLYAVVRSERRMCLRSRTRPG